MKVGKLVELLNHMDPERTVYIFDHTARDHLKVTGINTSNDGHLTIRTREHILHKIKETTDE